jgi:hypothetical protein
MRTIQRADHERVRSAVLGGVDHMSSGYCGFVARLTGAVGPARVLYFAIIAFVAVLLLVWAKFGQ